MDKNVILKSIKFVIEEVRGIKFEEATNEDIYVAISSMVRSEMRKLYNKKSFDIKAGKKRAKIVSYLSAEFLLGKQLQNALVNLNLEAEVKDTIEGLGHKYQDVLDYEPEPSLGNGGLGRLAACYIDSMATTNTPSISYGIRYEYGIFKQKITSRGQVETPDFWLDKENPWEVRHFEKKVKIGFGGKTITDENKKVSWHPSWNVIAVPYNYLVPGYNTENVNMLRLWKSEATNNIDLKYFNKGDYSKAAADEVRASTISKVLYPEDSTVEGKKLRLEQQYFFVAASIQDLLSYSYGDWEKADLSDLPERAVFQLNDTHPVIGIPELMRLLVDVKEYDWDKAWDITTKVFNYTCHTLLPEALEVWPEEIFSDLLPRHLEIIFEINHRFLHEVYKHNLAPLKEVGSLSIIQDEPFRGIRMANLATIGGTNVNGVAKLHSDLLKETTLNQFYKIWPEKFKNVTNGVTPRRFIKMANPLLSDLITRSIGEKWITDLDELQGLEKFAEDSSFIEEFQNIKRDNKVRYSNWLKKHHNQSFDPDSMVDSMIKRIHEYKRQHLRLLEVISIYNDFKNGKLDLNSLTPRTIILAGKSAPGYAMAKEIIKLAVNLSETINSTPGLNEKVNIIFHPNYNVTGSSYIVPATDLSEQISLAGKEASGTGNMKFALNGALTVGTNDGANVEIRNLVGPENFYLFGMEVEEVEAKYAAGYKSSVYYENCQDLQDSMSLLVSGEFSKTTNENFLSLADNLINRDPFMVLADFDSYHTIQKQINNDYQDKNTWSKKAILNIARSGFFSSDRAIEDYKSNIWSV
jgi:starch phosphorylase